MAEKPTVRCPHCKTSFHIHAEHLAIAKGAGRCGSCLQVFNIADQLPSKITSKDIIPSDQRAGSSKLNDPEIHLKQTHTHGTDDQDSLFDEFFDQLSQGEEDTLKTKSNNPSPKEIEKTLNKLQEEPFDTPESSFDTLIDEQPHKNHTPIWLTLSFIMLLIMLAQIAYFKFDTLSQDPSYRPIYSILCQVVDCQLPELQDVSQISTQHFTVRQHPSIEQALSIDTLLINNSPYPQSFPDLKITFTDLENQVIASRLFRPKEYLAGELAGQTTMLSQVPIHIALEIVNPGDNAMNYQIELISNH